MSEDSFKNTIVALVLFVGFAWLILSITVDFGNEYGRSSAGIGNGSLNTISFQSSAENVSTSAHGYRTRFEGGNVDDIDDASGIFSIATDIINMITAPFTLISQILTNIFGVPSLIINIVLGDYEENDINRIMTDYGRKVNNLIFMKYDEMGMDTEEKRQEYESIVMNIVNLVYGSYARAKEGGERRSLREMINIQQTHQSQGTGQMMMQGGGQPRARGILNPMRFLSGKYA